MEDLPKFVKKARETEEMSRWVHDLAPWAVIAHHTFVWEASVWSAQKSYERFMSKSARDLSYFYALEQNPGRPGFHVHALWADCEAVQRRRIWALWKETYGRNRIEPVRGLSDVARYCSKYVTKEGAWWNVKLTTPDLWHAATRKGGGNHPPDRKANQSSPQTSPSGNERFAPRTVDKRATGALESTL